MYVEADDEVGGDVVEDPTEEKVVMAEVLGVEDVAEDKEEEEVEDGMVVGDTIVELANDETAD